MSEKAKKKKTRGRPSAYRPEYAAQAEKLAKLGAIDKEMADFFGVAESTINLWKLEHPEFSESVKSGKLTADAEVASKLFHRATGYEHADTHVSNYQGAITLTPLVKHYAPDPTAAIFWLKNRQPDKWRDKLEHGHDLTLTMRDASDDELDQAIAGLAAKTGAAVGVAGKGKKDEAA